MPAEPSRVRRQLGFELKRARNAAGVPLRAFDTDAERAGHAAIRHPRLQRAERGDALLTDEQLATFLALVAPGDEVRERLEVLHAQSLTETTRWSLAMENGGHLQQVAADLERDSALLCVVEVAWLPGLLQTDAYARGLFSHLREVLGPGHDDTAAAAARMRRQDVLHEPGHAFRFLLHERLLVWSPGPEVSMDAQRDRIDRIADLASVEVRLLAATDRLPMSGFTLHEQMADGTAVVALELEHGSLPLHDPADVDRYRTVFARLWAGSRELRTP